MSVEIALAKITGIPKHDGEDCLISKKFDGDIYRKFMNFVETIEGIKPKIDDIFEQREKEKQRNKEKRELYKQKNLEKNKLIRELEKSGSVIQ